MSLPRLLLVLMLALACVSAAASALGCAAFSAAPDGDAGSAEASTSTDGSVAADAGECFDLTSAAPDFRSASNSGGSLTVSPGQGLAVGYPDRTAPDAGDSYAAWEHKFPVAAGASGATVTLEADLTLPLTSPPPGWYAELGSLVHGDSASSTTAVVGLALSDVGANIAQRIGLDVNTFPSGGVDGPLNVSSNVGFVALGVARQPVKVVLDVTWSAFAAPGTVVASIDNQPPASLSAVTLTSPPEPSWTLILGGAASINPAMTILYTRACVRVRP